MSLYHVWRNEPMVIVRPDGIDADKVHERHTEQPTVVEEIAHRKHSQRRVDVSQRIQPNNTASVVNGVHNDWARVSAIVPYAIPMRKHQGNGHPF